MGRPRPQGASSREVVCVIPSLILAAFASTFREMCVGHSNDVNASKTVRMAETAGTVYEKEGIRATFDEDKGVVWLGLSSCPDNSEIDKMWTILSTFITNHPSDAAFCILPMSTVPNSTLLSCPHSST